MSYRDSRSLPAEGAYFLLPNSGKLAIVRNLVFSRVNDDRRVGLIDFDPIQSETQFR